MIGSTITDALHDWVAGVTDREPVFDNVANMGPRSTQRSCSMVLGATPIGHLESLTEDIPVADGDPPIPIPEPNVRERALTNYVLSISMNLLGGNDTLGDMNMLRESMGLSSWHDPLYAAGLAFSRVSIFRDLSELVKHEPEPRHQADWEFLARGELTADIPSIEQVEIVNAGNGSSFIVGA